METMPPPSTSELREAASSWWIVLIIGILWIIYAWIVLSFNFSTVLAIVVFAGVAFIFSGLTEFYFASQVDDWKWLYIVLGVISIAAGIIALVWPNETFLVLAALIGWYLMFRGLFDIMTAIMVKGIEDLWWLGLVVGAAEIVIGFWAIGYSGRSIALLVVWVGAYALLKGITDMFLAFKLRGAKKRLAPA